MAEATIVAPGVLLVRDTCNVYLIETGNASAVAIDFGSGEVAVLAEDLGLTITDVLMTHHHRDQAQGLPLAVDHGIRIHVPPVEVELFRDVEEMWQSTRLANNYGLRQDRFSLLESVPVHATVPEYRELRFGTTRFRVVPTPGHTMGSVSYLLEREGQVLAFTGDLIYAPGKVWSIAASQWSYSNQEGSAMTVLSALSLGDLAPDILLPSHGEVMPEGVAALAELVETMQDYVDSRRPYPWDLNDRLRNPFRPITQHLLLNHTSVSCSYVLLSKTGEALFIDYGYDMTTGILNETDRSARRPWLASVPALKRQYGVSRISVALPTHYHDDHLAGMPLLRDVEGTEIWVPDNFSDIIADPLQNDLPCQWYDAIIADRVLELGVAFRWNEYTITPHDQPGHTHYAVAYEVEVDGVVVMFTGDQQEGRGIPGERREYLNYQYRNRFELGDYSKSAALYRRVAPGLLATGHWEPRWVEEGYLDYLVVEGELVDSLHQRILPLKELELPVDGMFARMSPYRGRWRADEQHEFVVSVRNPFAAPATTVVSLALPSGWAAVILTVELELAAHETRPFRFEVVTGPVRRRARIAADITIGELRLGQHTESIVDIVSTP